ncbi:hypothetical protein [Flavobacterium sp. 7A]|uniref:hypothetical protein n=1 Tax=Flavobacterium sp. 7A TaxID=2940571 RepID=UPI002227D3CD|nr:hypothetical protein [Flavobacterium sp. 7A]MCW2120635.1 polygalacturonase [Flavobacterium sp. 7A]
MKNSNNSFFKIVAIAFAIITLFSFEAKETWDALDFGTKGDNKTSNTKAFQSVVDTCTQAGGVTVLIEGRIYISGK